MNLDYHNALMAPHIIVDTREQTPAPITAFRTVRDALPVGDYGIVGFSKWDYPAFVLERKTLADFVACCGVERERFMRELFKMRQYNYKAVLVEGTEQQVREHDYRSNIAPDSVLSTVDVIQTRMRIQFCWVESALGCARKIESQVRIFCQGIVRDVERLERAAREPGQKQN